MTHREERTQWDGLDHKIVGLTFNANGTTTVTDGAEQPQTHGYDLRSTLTDETNQWGGTTQKTYDPNFRPATITDPDISDPNKRTTILDWSDNGANLEYIMDASGGETFIRYEDLSHPDNPTEITDPLSNKTKYSYTDNNFPTLPTKIEYFEANAALVSSTQYQYYPSGGSAGKVELITDALLHKTHYTYTPSGQPDVVITAYQTPNAQRTDYNYDDLGRMIRVKDASGVITRNIYDAAGRLTVTIHNEQPGTPLEEENPLQNLVSGNDIYNLYTRYYYDLRGNQIAMVDTEWNITRTYYDLANRRVEVVKNLVINGTPANDEADVTAALDLSSGQVPSFDSNHSDWNMQTDTEYDDAGQVIVERDPLGIITRTYFDPANRRQLVVQNWAGTDLYGAIDTAPAYDPAYPDRNIHIETRFDANGNAIATIDTAGIITRTYYDELNRTETIVKNLTGHQIDYPFAPVRSDPPDPEHNLRTDMYYDGNGNLIGTEDPGKVFTRTFYDALNRPTIVVQNWEGNNIYSDPAPDRSQGECGIDVNVCSETFYDQVGNVILTIDPRGVPTSTEYDEANRPKLIVQNSGGAPDEIRQTEITYAANGRRDTTTDLLGHVTRYDYNHIGQLLQETVNYLANSSDPNFNIITQYTYDALGRQLTQEDALGRVNKNNYDDLGRLKSVTQNFLAGHDPNYKDSSGDQYNLIANYVYDIQGNQIAQSAVKDINTDVVTRTYYDAIGRPTNVVRNLTGSIYSSLQDRSDPPDPLANIRTDTFYLGNGNVDYVVDETGKITDYSYDDVGRLISAVDPESNPTNYGYDANGNRILMTTFVTSEEPVSTKYEYDGLNRLKAVIENYREDLGSYKDSETNVRTDYTYDAGGNRLSIQDGQSNLEDSNYETTFEYDPLGRIKKETDPLGLETQYTYSHDAMGNIVSIRDAMLKTTVYHYDELDRLYSIEYPEGDENYPSAGNVTYHYDALGRRTKMTDGLGDTIWSYNNLDRPETISAPLSPTVSYDYDWRGNRSNLSYADQAFVYQYNDLDQLHLVSGSGLPDDVEYGYDAAGHLMSVTRPNGVNTAYHYFENGWLKDIIHSSGSTTLASYQYDYYKNGNRKQAIESILFPSVPPTATPTSTPTEILTSTPTFTLTPSSTSTPTESTTPTPTFTLTNTLTVTNTPTETPTFTPTATDTPTETPAFTPTETPTFIPTASDTPTPSLTATPTFTSTPTNTSTATQTPTHTPTSTSTPTVTPTSIASGGDTVGVFRPSNGAIYLKNSNTAGDADIAINFGLPGDYPVVGDWDGDGTTTIGVYRNGTFYLRNSNTSGFADIAFAFGVPGDQPIAGDWNGDGIDTIGLYRSSTFTFYLRNSNTAGAPDISFSLGSLGDVGVAGDWNGDGLDTTGVFHPGTGEFYLKNTNTTGFADIQFTFGMSGDKPLTGDWNNDGFDTIGVYRGNIFYLRNSNTTGFADIAFAFGVAGDMPVAGNWDGVPSMLSMSTSSICLMDSDSWLLEPDLSESSANLDPLNVSPDCDVYLSPEEALEMGISVAKDAPLLSESSTLMSAEPVTITYNYDKLNRLTEANYSNGDYYYYTYDAVGNRKSQESLIDGLLSTDSYNYDHANRLTDVNGVLYAWDANGNLRSDGANSYAYDSANRLKTFTQGTNTSTFSYTGLGDRISQNGVNYTLDLNTGLTQVLTDGGNTYLYGVGRIAQANGTSTEYFLGDALVSVRQLTNTNGNITLTKSFAPYGNLAQSLGSAQTAYGFTNEYTSQGLIYLRSRTYDPYLNQFIQPDTIVPDPYQPMDWNKYLYVRDNPINYTDPSGHYPKYGENLPDRRDLTDWLPRAAVYMANDPEVQEIKRLSSSPDAADNSLGLFKFYNVVRDGSRFDVKDKIKDQLGRDIKLGDNWYEFSVTGNILYGFVGSVAGYGEQTLHRGAGYAQVTDNLRWLWGSCGIGVLFRSLFGGEEPGDFPNLGGYSVHYFDTPDDYHGVEFGIWLYQEYYAPTGNFTLDNFVQGLNNYELAWGLPGVPDPGDYKPNTSGPYAPDEFNQ